MKQKNSSLLAAVYSKISNKTQFDCVMDIFMHTVTVCPKDSYITIVWKDVL